MPDEHVICVGGGVIDLKPRRRFLFSTRRRPSIDLRDEAVVLQRERGTAGAGGGRGFGGKDSFGKFTCGNPGLGGGHEGLGAGK